MNLNSTPAEAVATLRTMIAEQETFELRTGARWPKTVADFRIVEEAISDMDLAGMVAFYNRRIASATDDRQRGQAQRLRDKARASLARVLGA